MTPARTIGQGGGMRNADCLTALDTLIRAQENTTARRSRHT